MNCCKKKHVSKSPESYFSSRYWIFQKLHVNIFYSFLKMLIRYTRCFKMNSSVLTLCNNYYIKLTVITDISSKRATQFYIKVYKFSMWAPFVTRHTSRHYASSSQTLVSVHRVIVATSASILFLDSEKSAGSGGTYTRSFMNRHR